MIYFIKAGEDGPIKIGYAVDPIKRMRQLQTGSTAPLRMLASFEGDQKGEKSLHRMFSDLRIEGEWFRPEPPLLDFIRDNPVAPGWLQQGGAAAAPPDRARDDAVEIGMPSTLFADPATAMAAPVYAAAKLAAMEHPEGRCVLSVAAIGKAACVCERHVRRQLDLLVSTGHIVEHAAPGLKTGRFFAFPGMNGGR